MRTWSIMTREDEVAEAEMEANGYRIDNREIEKLKQGLSNLDGLTEAQICVQQKVDYAEEAYIGEIEPLIPSKAEEEEYVWELMERGVISQSLNELRAIVYMKKANDAKRKVVENQRYELEMYRRNFPVIDAESEKDLLAFEDTYLSDALHIYYQIKKKRV